MTSIIDTDRNRVLALLFIATYCIAQFAHTLLNPSEVWDMLGYAASVHSLTGASSAEIHATVFSDLKAYATPAEYQELTSSTPYRITMSTDPEAFSQQIPFYKIRLLYVFLLLALTKCGIGMYEATHILSAAFANAGILVLFLGLRNYVHSVLWIVVPVFFYGITTNQLLIQQGGVDTFAFFWMSLTVVCYLRGSKFMLPALALCVLVRTDLIIHAALMFTVLLLTDKTIRTQVVLWGLATLVIYFTVNTWAGNYGWKALIYFVFVTEMSATHPAIYSAHVNFSVSEYLGFIFNRYDWISKWLWLSIGCALASLFVYFRYLRPPANHSPRDKDSLMAWRMNIVSATCVAYVVLHYLLFPAIFMRFFIGSCLLMVLAMLCTATHLFSLKYAAVPRGRENISTAQPDPGVLHQHRGELIAQLNQDKISTTRVVGQPLTRKVD